MRKKTNQFVLYGMETVALNLGSSKSYAGDCSCSATGTLYTANNEIQNCFINKYFSYQASSAECLCKASQSVNGMQ